MIRVVQARIDLLAPFELRAQKPVKSSLEVTIGYFEPKATKKLTP